jgi:hypothetical protein
MSGFLEAHDKEEKMRKSILSPVAGQKMVF